MASLRVPSRPAALVTGGSRGIGKVVAVALAAAGYAVAINYRSGSKEAHQVVHEITSMGGSACAVQADMADICQAEGLVERVETVLGPLAVLVNNAGITRDRLLIQMSDDDWQATWLTDLAGPRALARAAVRSMHHRRGGRIINVSSVVGVTGNAGQANYAAAKSAIMGLTRELAVRCAPHSITVNCVVPGYILTDATAHLTEEQRAGWLRRIPLGRFASAEEVSHLIVFLCSSSAAYITGQCIAIDGGYCAVAEVGDV